MSQGLLEGSDDFRRGFRRIVLWLVALVLVPTVALLVLGILMLVYWNSATNLIFGLLVVTLVGCLVAGATISLLLVRREAQIAKLQTDFVSKVSHELRTPLTSIRMFVETLQAHRYSGPEELEMCLDVLARETTRLNERIQRLLDWGRMESGRRIYELKLVAPSEIVKAALAAFETATVGRSVPVMVSVAEDLPEIEADQEAIVDALLNLLGNAFKYTGDEKRIELTARIEGKFVAFSVLDNGVGIARSEHRRIFEKFYRVDDRLSRSVEGSGLGLAIVRHVVKAHRGRVEVDSTPGTGSRFTLLIPRPKPHKSERSPGARPKET